jgi:prepilin-type N-terminal cleavage/methylation domain-containing protein
MKRNKAFTLIELLVVISIISLLSSIVLTSLTAAREKAQIAKYQATFTQIRNAIQEYENDNDVLPFSGGSSHSNYLAMMDLLVPDTGKKYLVEKPDLVEMQKFFNMRTSSAVNDNDPRIGFLNNFRCEGDTNPSRYVFYFQDLTPRPTKRFEDDLPYLLNPTNHYGATGYFYCPFTPIS